MVFGFQTKKPWISLSLNASRCFSPTPRQSRSSLMAAISHFSSFASVSSCKHFVFPLYSSSYTVRGHQHCYPTISASSAKGIRGKREVKSNAELCKDILEFMSMVGLPEGHVPSLKELSLHGRQDLANIVRRRGYKLIKQLLATSNVSDENGTGKEVDLIGVDGADGTCQYISIGQDQKLEDMNEGVLSSDEVILVQSHFKSGKEAKSRSNFSFQGESDIPVEDSLQDTVEKFVESGELDSVEDDALVKFENLPRGSKATGEEGFEGASDRSSSDKILNGSILVPNQVVLCASENDNPRGVYFSSGLSIAQCDEESEIKARTRVNQAEVNRLKFMLHQKELELSRLKGQIEKEKLALSVMQGKAEKEMRKAQKFILEKDAELLAAEECLSELKEVQVQYCGDGETVEVSGSFNGWHQSIVMDPQQSSSVFDPTKSRNPRVWSTVLWLYPGTYEIKFIVDGQWRIDPQRESVSTGTIQNNVLRVDRC